MAKGKAQFVGASGQYYVAYELSIRDIIANITIGNAPGVDILVTDDNGLNSVSIQVKTSRWAYRSNRYGSEGFEWDVSASVIGRQSHAFWYAFVDLQDGDDGCKPQTFIVPSKWVSEFVLPTFSRKMYFLPMTAYDLTFERWDYIRKTLDNDNKIIKFANNWPEDKLVRWGT